MPGKYLKPDWPFKPASLPFYYGWLVAVFAAVTTVCSIPGQTAGIGVFKDYLMDSLELSSVQLSISYMAGGIVAGLAIPLIGPFFDKHGIRIWSFIAYIVFGLSIFYMSRCEYIYAAFAEELGSRKLYLAYGLIIVGYFLLRFLGHGVTAMIGRIMVAKWFDRKRGLVVPVSAVVVSLCFASTPRLLHEGIERFSASTVWFWMAVFLFCVMSLVALLFHRDNPEECGLLQDGDAHPKEGEKKREKRFPVYRHYTLKEALGTAVFWAFASGLALNGVVATSFMFHATDISVEFGVKKEMFMGLFIPAAVCSIMAGFVLGWLGDRAELKWVLCIMMLGLSLSGIGFVNLKYDIAKAAFVIGNGVSWAGFGYLTTGMAARYFGLKSLGSINSCVASMTMIATAVGPFIYSQTQAYTSSYSPAITVFYILPLMLSVGACFLKNPQLKHKA